MGKQKTRNQELERHASGRFITLFSNWAVNWLQNEDFAFDFELRPVREFTGSDDVEPTPWHVQLKASESFDDPDNVYVGLETEYLLDAACAPRSRRY